MKSRVYFSLPFSFFVINLFLSSIAGANPKVFDLTEVGSDFQVPGLIWKQIGGLSEKDALVFKSIQVRLIEKTPQVLISPEIWINLPRGGGEIDLAQFVTEKQGTFTVFFDIGEIKDESKLKIFYISQAKKRKVDGEIWGAGCRKFMDVKSYISRSAFQKGIEVNTTRNRHDSVLGGSFVFSIGPQVTQVTFTDSKQTQLFCETTIKSDGK